MKQKSKLSKFVSVFTAAIMCFVMLPKVSTSVSAANVGDKLSVGNGMNRHKGNCDGYSYEVWIDKTGGSGSMTLGKGAAFKAEWSASVSQGNFLARRGLDFGSTKKATDYPYIGLDYDATYSQTGNGGNSRLCVYGWFENRNAAGNPPLVEYYIIEDWVNWRPTANGASKTVTIDDGQYEIFAIDHTGPTIHGNTEETFKQYFSVRKDTRTSGHITVSDHFKAWADQGWGIGNLYEVALNAEGWESSGVADVKKLDVYTDPDNRDPNVGPVTPVTPTVEPDKDGNYFYDTFESGAGDWAGRGDASVTTDSKNYYAGSKSLAVTGRTDNWHGAAISLDSSAFVPGNTYSFSTGVLQKSGSATEMKLTLQYSLNGEENYDEVASATAKSGEWTKLENTSYTIPSGATNLVLYVEAPDSLTDFYIDEAKGSKEGVKSSVVNGGGTVDSTTTPVTPVTPSIPTGDSLKGKFGSLFRMGTSVSPNELSSGKDFILKHFNSITPENELKPDALLQQQASIQGGDNNHAVISLDRAAQTLKFCEDNGLGLRGHTFVWYSQTPDWFFKEGFQSNGAYVSKDTMNKRLENFIKDTFAALKSQYPKLDVYSYDVCNELFINDGGGLRPGSNSGWTRVYGDTNDEFIINAFTYARKYAPSTCKLYINDYNEYIPAKTNDIYNIAMKLKELNVIDGIGMQSHLATNYPDAKTYKAGLEKFLSTGLEVQITELDIETKGNADARAKLFKEVFQMAVDHADQIPAFTVWGTHDSISWRSSETPLLFTSGYQPKPDYDAVMSINVPTSSVVTTTAANPVVTTTTTSTSGTDLKVTLWGDANNNGKLEIADAVLIMQAVANVDGYGVGGTNKDCLTPQGKVNADCYQPGSDLTSMDALAVQKALVNLVKLPEGDSVIVNTTTTKAPAATTTTAAPQKINPTEYMASVRATMTNNVPSSATKSNQYGTLEKITYYSSTAGRNKSANVLLPEGYSKNEKYPVLYVNHGIFGDEESMLGMGIRDLAGNLISSGEAEKMIIVFPNMFSSKTSASPGGMDQSTFDGYDMFLDDLTKDLMPYIEKNYSIKTGRENTAISGFSMGGRESLYIGVSRPDLFGYIGAACPAPGVTPGQDSFANHPGNMSESEFKIKDTANYPYLWIITGGTNDSVVGTFPQKYHEILTTNGQDHIWQEIQGGGHDSSCVTPLYYNFLRNIFKTGAGSSSNNTSNNNNNTSNANFFNNTFSSGTDGWEERGSVSLSLDSNTYYSAGNSLKVAGRSETWHGAQITLDSSFKAGSTYSFSAAVMQASGSDLDAKMTLQYTLDGEDNYASIDLQTAKNKEWTKLENTAFTIPSGAVNPVLYIELPDSTADFYIDDIQVAEKGTASKVVTGKGTIGNIPDAPVVTPGTIDPSKPMVAISFDDGAVGSSANATSMRIINALAKQDFRATFFYVGDWIRNADGEQEVKYAYSKGMEIANHSTSHPDLSTKSASEIRSEYDKCAAKLKGIIGTEPSKLLRLPYLGCNDTVKSTLNDVPLITCSIDTGDWNNASKDQIVNKIKQAMNDGSLNGAIVLCHETYETTAAAMEELAPYLKEQGWQIVTISEMFAAKGKTLNGGQIYTNCK